MPKRQPNLTGYRTPNIFRRNQKHKIAKIKIFDKIKRYAKIKKTKSR